MTLLIMAAGMGSRYGGPKQIDPMTPHGEFIIDFSIYDALAAGFDKVCFIIKEENLEDFRETVGKRIGKKVDVSYAFQKMGTLPEGFTVPEGRTKPWGTGQAVLSAADIVKEPFAVINADDYYGRDAFVKLHDFLASDGDQKDWAMAGYILENTITENGSVARGICEVEGGKLVKVTERTKIQENDGKIQYLEGEEWHDLDRRSIVSMNCWAFKPSIFPALRDGFTEFLRALPDAPDPKKAEFFLPSLVQHEIDRNECTVTVLETSAKWYGVTYHDDKPKFVNFITSEIKKGTYPDGLWK